MKSVETERRWMREERRWLNEASHSKPQRDVLSVKFNTIPRRTVPHTRIKRKLRNLGFDNLEQALQSQIWAFSRQKVTFWTLMRPRSTRAQILCSRIYFNAGEALDVKHIVYFSATERMHGQRLQPSLWIRVRQNLADTTSRWGTASVSW